MLVYRIAPILFELAQTTNVKYPLDVDDKLSGYVDYLIHAKQEFIIKAKKGDVDRGFNQLATELIALDKYEDDNGESLYGAVTIGEMWVFAVLNRKTKHYEKFAEFYAS